MDYWDDPALTIALRRYRDAKDKRGLRFCFIEDGGRLDRHQAEAWPRLVGFFRDPDYLKVCDGRPLLFVFGKPAAIGNADSLALGAATIAAGLPKPYIVLMGWHPPSDWKDAQTMGFDAVSTYAAGGQYAGVREALAWTAHNPDLTPANAVIIYAWNENDEGDWLVPTWTAQGKPNTDRIEAVDRVGDQRGRKSSGGQKYSLWVVILARCVDLSRPFLSPAPQVRAGERNLVLPIIFLPTRLVAAEGCSKAAGKAQVSAGRVPRGFDEQGDFGRRPCGFRGTLRDCSFFCPSS